MKIGRRYLPEEFGRTGTMKHHNKFHFRIVDMLYERIYDPVSLVSYVSNIRVVSALRREVGR